MRIRKLCLMDFAMHEYDLLQRRLEDMAQKGWMLDRVWSLGMFWFRRAEPKTVRYAVTYAPSGSAYNSRPTDQEEDLTALCRDAGWVKAGSFAQMHIYVNEDPNATPLETDDNVFLDSLARAMQKQNSIFVLLAVLFSFNLYMHISNLIRWPTTTWTSNLSLGAIGAMAVLVIFYLLIPLTYYLWLYRARKAVHEGMLIPTPLGYRVIRVFLNVYIVVFVAVIGLSVGWNLLAVIGIVTVGLLVSVQGTMAVTKAMNAPKWVNIAVPFLVTLFLLTAVTPLMLDPFGKPSTPSSATQPILIEELIGTEETPEREVWNESASFLADRVTYIQTAGEEQLHIFVLNTGSEFVWEQCLNYLEQDLIRYAAYDPDTIDRPNQGDLWGAEYARQIFSLGNHKWLVCWDGRLVTISTTWELTQEQIDQVAEALRP